jgi:hypothetical protein
MEWFGQAIRESPHTDKIGRRVRAVLTEWIKVLLDNAAASFFERDESVFLLRVAIVFAAKRAVEEGDTDGGSNSNKKKDKSKSKEKGGIADIAAAATASKKTTESSKSTKKSSKSSKEVNMEADPHSMGKLIRNKCKIMERKLSATPGLNASIEMPEIAESFASNPKGWDDYWNGKSRSAPIKGLSPFEHLLIVRLFGEPQRLPDAVLEFCRQELGEDAVQPRTTDLKKVLTSSTCSTPIVLFAEPGSSIDISPLARANRRRVSRLPMGGKDEGETAMAAIHAASKAGEWVLLEGIHLCGPFLLHLSRVMEDIVEAGEEVERKQDEKQMKEEMEKVKLSPKNSPSNHNSEEGEKKMIQRRRRRKGDRRASAVNGDQDMQKIAAAAAFSYELKKDNFRVRGPIHKSFRLWCITRPVENHFPVSMLQESVCVVIEAVTGLRSNCLQSLTTVPLSQREFWSVEREDDGENGNGSRSTRLFELVWFHALAVSRGTFGALGYSG